MVEVFLPLSSFRSKAAFELTIPQSPHRLLRPLRLPLMQQTLKAPEKKQQIKYNPIKHIKLHRPGGITHYIRILCSVTLSDILAFLTVDLKIL